MSVSRCGRGRRVLQICGRAEPKKGRSERALSEEGTSERVQHGHEQADLGILEGKGERGEQGVAAKRTKVQNRG